MHTNPTRQSLIEAGLLCPFSLERIDTEIDLREVGVIGKEFDPQELDKVICENASDIAEEIYQHGHDILPDGELRFRSTIIFTPHANSAKAITAALCEIDIEAIYVSHHTLETVEIFERLKSGKSQCLVVVQTIAEVDVTWIEMVVLACPSLHVDTVTQKIERFMCHAPQTGNNSRTILEFIGQTNPGQELAGVLDIILRNSLFLNKNEAKLEKSKNNTNEQKKMMRKLKKRAQKFLDSGEIYDPLQAVNSAREFIEEKKQIKRERKLEAKRTKQRQESVVEEAKITERLNEPVPIIGVTGIGVPTTARAAHGSSGGPDARPEQMQELYQLSGGLLGGRSHNIDAAEARRQIELLKLRDRLGLATPRQVKSLIDKGIEFSRANTMSARQANEILSSLKSQGE